jgi:hypothetical protein
VRPALRAPERWAQRQPEQVLRQARMLRELPQQVPPRLGLLLTAQQGQQSPQERLPLAFALWLAQVPPRVRQALGEPQEPLPAVAWVPPTVPAVPQTAPELAIDR